MKLDTKPPKGTTDWDVQEFRIRNNIFKKWREVAERFGYEEYLTPIIESAEIYRAKSGEDVGGKELMTFEDRAGRELVIRPEMTPSITRLVSSNYETRPKPIRLFSIANFVRNEKPQRGRNREFWQLNLDIFGVNSLESEVEILIIALELMLAFNPPENSFVLKISHRKLIDDFLTNQIGVPKEVKKQAIVRILDKYQKLSKSEITQRLEKLELNDQQITDLIEFMNVRNLQELAKKFNKLQDSAGVIEVKKITDKLDQLGYAKYISYSPDIIRGFDYYDGLVFEIFDLHPENNRSLFGGGRYNGLGSIFGVNDLPAIGFAPGDETFKLFLESWELIAELKKSNQTKIYFPLISADTFLEQQRLAIQFREELPKNTNLTCGLEEQRLGKALKIASNQDYNYLIILGEEELKDNTIVIKNLETGEQTTIENSKEKIIEISRNLN